jgi:hypothetical protein
MSRKQYALLLLVVISSSILSSAVITWGIASRSKIRASEIELVDTHGKTRATLDSTGTLRLMDNQGRDRMVLTGFGGAQMVCSNQTGGTIVELQANPGSKCALEFYDSKGQTAARIGVNQGDSERPRLEVFKNGIPGWTVPE